ncbi:MAG: glycosyltransferase [Clostridiales bacterium]|nr:glycosyltransferase [Clostridiales bacterium]
MKAAVITLHQVCNYGTQLQAYATQEKLKEYFEDVVFIDYVRADTYGIGLMNTFTKGNPLKIPLILPTLLYWRSLFGNFRKNYLKLTEKSYFNEGDFAGFEDCADVYIAGSDQVWNTGWNSGVIPAFYLSFAPDEKPKFAFSSSFGRSFVTDDEVSATKKYINRFDAISMREESGVDILRNRYGYGNATRLIDPTLAMPPSFWRNVAPPSKIKGEYILLYNLNRSSELDKYALELAKRANIPLYRFCTRLDQVLRSGKSLVMPGIFDFVTLVDNAKYVLTDSFHATAFSMIMNTEPICVYPNNYSGRLSEFLKLVESEQRHALDFNDFDVLSRPVDFEKVNKILNIERKEVDRYLSMMKKSAERRRGMEYSKEQTPEVHSALNAESGFEEKPLISVLLPAYNVEKYIAKCIESVIHQTYTNLEIIIVDDCSPDNSGQIAEEYAKKDNRIKVFHHAKNEGLSAVRNKGIENATGEYVTFVDSDDWVEPDYVEYLFGVMRQTGADISTSKYFFTSRYRQQVKEDRVYAITPEDMLCDIFYNRVHVGVCNRLYKKSLFEGKKFRLESATGEGMSFNAQVMPFARSVGVGLRYTYTYNVDNPLSATKNPNVEKQAIGSVETMDYIKDILKSRGERLNKAVEYQYFTTSLYALTHLIRADAQRQYADFYKRLVKYCRKTAFATFGMEISKKQMLKSLLVGLSPALTIKASIIWRYKIGVKQKV